MKTKYLTLTATVLLTLSACTTQNQSHNSKAATDNVTAIQLPFQALGPEPGWSVIIDTNQQAEVLLDFGDRVLTIDLPEPEYTYAGTHFRSTFNQQPLSLDIIYKSCSDTMSDIVYDYEAVLRIEDQVLRGCGREL